MDWADIEQTAQLVYKVAGVDADQRGALRALAKALGARVFTVHAASLPRDGALDWSSGQPRIFLRQGINRARHDFALAHELAELLLAKEFYEGDDAEEFANALGAALLAPRQLFLRVLRRAPDFRSIAQELHQTESFAALRYGETTWTPLVLVAPQSVRVRGGEFVWPEESELRRLAKREIPGLARTSLQDDPRRVVLAAG
jgi:hypothetical protein